MLRRSVGLQLGIAAGILAATLVFAFSYAQVHVTSFSVVPSRSGAARSRAQVRALNPYSVTCKAAKPSLYP